MSSNIDTTLTERGSRYGEFTEHALYTQDLKRAMQRVPANWHKLSDDKKEALEMVVHKIGRILNGDPEYIDSWHDIIGYVRLVEKNLEAAQAPPVVDPIGRKIESYSTPIEENKSLRVMMGPRINEHFCAAYETVKPGNAVECEGCKTAIYGPREI